MARTRALMTETERRRIAANDEVDDQKRYQAIAEVRNRIHDELVEDVRVLRDHHPELFAELHDVVCEEQGL